MKCILSSSTQELYLL